MKTKVRKTNQLIFLVRVKREFDQRGRKTHVAIVSVFMFEYTSHVWMPCSYIWVSPLIILSFVIQQQAWWASLCKTVGFVLVVPAAYRAGDVPGNTNVSMKALSTGPDTTEWILSDHFAESQLDKHKAQKLQLVLIKQLKNNCGQWKIPFKANQHV